MDAGIVLVPFSTQLLAAAVALQAFAFAVMVWRAFLGRPERFHQRPRWPLIPLVLGTAAGVWYAVIQRDLVMGAAQALALYVGFKLILGAGPARSGEPPLQGTRRERRAAAREAKRKGRADD